MRRAVAVAVAASKRVGGLRLGALLFSFVFGLNAYFFNGYGWNQTARYDPIWSFVEPGPHQYTLRIDDFITDEEVGINTGDFARNLEHDEHYYSNKAPGTSLLGVPVYFALYHGERIAGLNPTSIQGVFVNAYLIHLWVTVLPVALSSLFFLALATRLTRSREQALTLTLVMYGGTLMLPFSTMMWGHTTAAAFCVMSLACFMNRGRRSLFWSGGLIGLAVLTDYGAAPIALSLVAAAWISSDRRPAIGAFMLGGLGPLMLFGSYHWMLFGSPFKLASSYSPPEMISEGGYMGLFGRFQPGALWGLTFGTARGLFIFMPILFLSVVVLGQMLRGHSGGSGASGRVHPVATAADDRWLLAGLALANILAALVINASFNAWQGGVTAGARYQIAVLPFYGFLLTMLPTGPRWRRAILVLGAISVVNMFIIASVSPMAPDALHGSPLLFSYAKVFTAIRTDLGFLPAPGLGASLSRGSLHLYPIYLMRDWGIGLTDPIVARWATFNVGERLFGLRGTLSLLPVVLGCALLATAMRRSARADDDGGLH
ncbi:MAG: hypothetical protein E4G90_08470, partial [Gemmatimonadales bacterium]